MGDVIIDKMQPMSRSLLWELQNTTYTEFGPQAWSSLGVPFYITSNPYIAHSYAHVVLGYLRDCLAPNAKTPVDPGQTFYIFDVGAGSGRFSYACVRFLKNIYDSVLPKGFKIKYVLCDMVEDNIRFWEQHPYWKRYIDEGFVDFATYSEASPPEKMSLRISGEVLDKNNMHNPVCLLCNYLFDTIPQDLFRVHDGKIEEGLVTLSVPNGEGKINPKNPAIIPNLKLSYDYRPIKDVRNYYPDDPAFGELLELYGKTFKDTSFLFPIRPLKTIQYFAELSKNRLLMVAGDQGVSSFEQVQHWGKPVICRHASFSFSVSYHAIAEYFKISGGFGLLTSFPHNVFVVTTSLLGGREEEYKETTFAFREHLNYYEPRDYWRLLRIAKDEKEKLSFEQILLFIKLGYWDPVNFNVFYDRIREQLPKASDELRRDLYGMIYQVLDMFYPVSMEEGVFIMNLGVLLYDLQHYREAIPFFERSMELTGERTTALENIGRCYRMIGEEEKGSQYLQRAEALAAAR